MIKTSAQFCDIEVGKLLVSDDFLLGNVLTLWASRAAGSGTGDSREQVPLSCTHMGRKCKKNPTLYWRKLNEHSENVSFDSEFALAFEIQRFKVAFFIVFLNANFLNANFSFCNIKFSIHFNYLWILSLHLSLGQYYFIKQVSLMHTKMLLVIIKLQFVDSRRPF